MAVRGKVTDIGIVMPLPIRGVFLSDGSIGPYTFGIEIGSTDIDPADLLDRVTIESADPIVFD